MSVTEKSDAASGKKRWKPWQKNLIFALVVLAVAAALYFGWRAARGSKGTGLNFYYFISLFFSAAIMWTLRKTTDDEKLLAILEKRYQENKNNPKKASGLMARMQALQEMQRQQQAEMMRKQAELNEKKNNLGK